MRMKRLRGGIENIHRVETRQLQSLESVRQHTEGIEHKHLAETPPPVARDGHVFSFGINADCGESPRQQCIYEKRRALAGTRRSHGQNMAEARIVQRMATVGRIADQQRPCP